MKSTDNVAEQFQSLALAIPEFNKFNKLIVFELFETIGVTIPEFNKFNETLDLTTRQFHKRYLKSDKIEKLCTINLTPHPCPLQATSHITRPGGMSEAIE